MNAVESYLVQFSRIAIPQVPTRFNNLQTNILDMYEQYVTTYNRKFDIGFSSDTYRLVTYEEGGSFSLIDRPNTLSSLLLRVGTDIIETERSVYTYFDLLGDIGGLQGTLISIFTTFLYFIRIFLPDQILKKISSKIYTTGSQDK